MEIVALFSNLLDLLNVNCQYKPENIEISILKLNLHLQEMHSINTTIEKSFFSLLKTRVHRNNILYCQENNALELMLSIKNYLRSLGECVNKYNLILSRLKFKYYLF